MALKKGFFDWCNLTYTTENLCNKKHLHFMIQALSKKSTKNYQNYTEMDINFAKKGWVGDEPT